MRHSITRKITAIMISIVAGTVLLCWFINTTLLESYYIEHKQRALLDTFDMVYKESENGRTDEDEFQIKLDTKSSNSDISYMIIRSDHTIIQSNVGDDERLLFQFLELIFHRNDGNTQVLKNTQEYVVEKTKDRRLNTDYLVLWGSLQNGIDAYRS